MYFFQQKLGEANDNWSHYFDPARQSLVHIPDMQNTLYTFLKSWDSETLQDYIKNFLAEQINQFAKETTLKLVNQKAFEQVNESNLEGDFNQFLQNQQEKFFKKAFNKVNSEVRCDQGESAYRQIATNLIATFNKAPNAHPYQEWIVELLEETSKPQPQGALRRYTDSVSKELEE